MKNKDVSIPKVILESGWLLDSSLESLSKESLNPEAIEEISIRIPEFQDAWDKFGTPLIKSALKESGLCFKEKDIKGVLICGPITSQSHPLIINAKYFLKALHTEPRSMVEFVEVVFHELLHILLQDNVRIFPTPVTQEFANEGFEVLAHLHLMALEKHAHEKLGNSVEQLKIWYQHIGPSYQKSWDLVSDEVIFSNLVKELNTEFGYSQ